jgi:hypothetical protein
MSANGYRLLGYVVWHGGRWYVRRRLLPARATVLRGGLAAAAALTVAALIARRNGA